MVEEILISLIKRETAQDVCLWDRINDSMLGAFKSIGLSFLKRSLLWGSIKRKLKKCINQKKSIFEIERELRPFFKKKIDFEKIILPRAKVRAKRNFEKVRSYLIGNRILDLGAGDGLLGELIKSETSKDVVLADVVDYNYTDLPLLLYKENESIPLNDNSIDTSIMYTVLHHSKDPGSVLREVSRVTTKRMIIMEGNVEEYETKIINSFIDWFFNRIVRGEDINVPLNYRKKNEWDLIFKEVGFEIVEAIDMGIDEPMVPERHILYVIDRFNS